MKKSYVLSVVGLLLTSFGMLSQFWFEELYFTYFLLGIGLLFCVIAIYLEMKKRINHTQHEPSRKTKN
jgi:hypothetical protein